MKISTRARYGLRGLFDIAYHNLGRPTHVKDTARRQGVTPRYLEQIFQSLKREGIVSAQRGPKGGYFLAREPEKISIGDVVRATEGPIRFSCDAAGRTEARKSGKGRKSRVAEGNGSPKAGAGPGGAEPGRAHEVTGAVWDELAEQVEGLLDGITLADLCARGEAEGLPREADARRIMYFI